MAMITAYFDESYSQAPPLVYTVACYIATDKQWSKFGKRWNTVLKREVQARWLEVHGDNEKKPLAFHMKDFASPHSKIYGDWPAKKKKKFLQELHSIIHRHRHRSFSVGIIVDDYNKLTDREKFFFGGRHICAAISCLKEIRKWQSNDGPKEQILYVFEKGTVSDSELYKLINTDLTSNEKVQYGVEMLAFGTKKLAPLQAADMLAYETRKEACRLLDGETTRNRRDSYTNLHVPFLDHWAMMNEYAFRFNLALPEAIKAMEAPGYDIAVRRARRRGLL